MFDVSETVCWGTTSIAGIITNLTTVSLLAIIKHVRKNTYLGILTVTIIWHNKRFVSFYLVPIVHFWLLKRQVQFLDADLETWSWHYFMKNILSVYFRACARVCANMFVCGSVSINNLFEEDVLFVVFIFLYCNYFCLDYYEFFVIYIYLYCIWIAAVCLVAYVVDFYIVAAISYFFINPTFTVCMLVLSFWLCIFCLYYLFSNVVCFHIGHLWYCIHSVHWGLKLPQKNHLRFSWQDPC